jgi:hypothetical protein
MTINTTKLFVWNSHKDIVQLKASSGKIFIFKMKAEEDAQGFINLLKCYMEKALCWAKDL